MIRIELGTLEANSDFTVPMISALTNNWLQNIRTLLHFEVTLRLMKICNFRLCDKDISQSNKSFGELKNLCCDHENKRDPGADQSWGSGQQNCVYKKYCQNKCKKLRTIQDPRSIIK